MKYPVVFVCLTLLCTLPASAQRGSGKVPGRLNAPDPGLGPPDLSSSGSIFITGKIVLDDGTLPTEQVAIQSVCRGQKHTETYSDSHGSFSFQLKSRASNTTTGLSDVDSSLGSTGQRSQRDVRDCSLQAVLPGFTSDSIDLVSRVNGMGNGDVGRLVLHRLAKAEGLTISATSAAAPPAAHKAMIKGLEQLQKEQYDDAQKSFEKAVEIYPKYAEAWFHLGEVQLKKGDNEAAKHSFNQSVAADSAYVNPYQGLAHLAAEARQWREVVNFTNKTLALNPINFPDAWFLSAAANYNLKDFDNAERSARQGIKIDEEKRIPRLNYLLGIILIEKRHYAEASQCIRDFLRTARESSEITDAQNRLTEIEKLSAVQNPVTDGHKE